MPLPTLGDIVNVRLPSGAARAAVIVAVHENQTADLHVWGGYCESAADLENVSLSDTGSPGTFYYPKGAKGIGRLAQPLEDPTNDIVALENGPDAAAAGDWLLIDAEYMTVESVINANNLKVLRAQGGSKEADHAAGATVKIGVAPPPAEEDI